MFVYLRRIELVFSGFKKTGYVITTQEIANVNQQWIERDDFYVVLMSQTVVAAYRRKTLQIPLQGVRYSCSEVFQVECERYHCYEQSCRSGEAKRIRPKQRHREWHRSLKSTKRHEGFG